MILRAALLAAVTTLGGCAGCGDECASLVVDVRSDYEAGDDVHGIRVQVNGGDSTTRSVGGLDDLPAGVRAAERTGLSGDSALVSIELLDRSGAVVASRRVRVALTCTTAITVVITRSCAGVVCPDGADPEATECVGGVCVRPDCTTPECGPGACMAAADCPPPSASCLQATCAFGACLYPEREGACEAGEVCDPERGCVVVGPPPDGGARDAGPSDAGCRGECDPGTEMIVDCGTCGRANRSCQLDCTWGPPSACTDSDERCPSVSAPSCIHDYCWGWRTTDLLTMACIDMSVDYGPGPELGTIGQEILGRPGATWTKENLQAACAGADYAPAESGTLDASGVGTWTFSYGTSDCSNGILGRYVSRMRIMDTDGTTFVLPGSPEVTFHNSTCTPDRATCEAARSFCSL